MRKLFTILIAAALVTLTACGREVAREEAETLVGELVETDVSPVEALKMVMLNEAPFDETRSDLRAVELHEFSQEAINEWVIDNSEYPENNKSYNERQDYLNSLNYLLDITYDYIYKDLESFNEDGKKYYYNCIAELNKIYELCIGRLTGNELEEFKAAQQVWQEGIDLRLAEDLCNSGQACSIEELDKWVLYYNYGDMILRRTLHLVNIYYGCQFCD